MCWSSRSSIGFSVCAGRTGVEQAVSSSSNTFLTLLSNVSHIELQRLLVSGALEILGEDVSYKEDFEEVFHAEHFLLLDSERLGCADGVFDLDGSLVSGALTMASEDRLRRKDDGSAVTQVMGSIPRDRSDCTGSISDSLLPSSLQLVHPARPGLY